MMYTEQDNIKRLIKRVRFVPMKVIDGWPCISESLQWAEGCPLYLMGQYTALQVVLCKKKL